MRFTKPTINKLTIPSGKSELIAFDDALPGFGIRLRGGGKRTWIVQYRAGKKQRRLTLGRADALSLDEAREAARTILAKVHLYHDPQLERNRARADEALTLGPLIERYLAFKASVLRTSSMRETTRYLTQVWRPLHSIPIAKVDRAVVAGVLAAYAETGGGVAADRARAALSAFFSWSMKEGLTPSNPVVATNRHSRISSRDRVLSDEEIKSVWLACGEDDFGRIVRLLLLTGQRREEIGGMAWSELSFEKRLWSLPASRTKNRRPHDVPLSDIALQIIGEIQHRDGRPLLFGASEGPFSGWSKAKKALDKRIDALAGREHNSWRLHDIRRTVATGMVDLGTPPHVVEAVLNHVSGARAGVAGVYNKSLYINEKRAALDRWATYVSSMAITGRV